MDKDQRHSKTAPGSPGIPARWTSSNKSGVGTALSASSRVWFTLSHGILNEIYYPRVDQACIRDLGLLVTDGEAYFSEEKRDAHTDIHMLEEGVPAFQITNTCNQGRYQIEKLVLSDPKRDVVLQSIKFVPLEGDLEDYHLYALLAPHLGNKGAGNSAWIGEYKGEEMLFAAHENIFLALASSVLWLKRSAGYVGFSDGWQDISQHKLMDWTYESAPNGNVALTGEVDLLASDGQFILSLGFGITAEEAGQRALASLQDGFDPASKRYIRQWERWQQTLNPFRPQKGFAHKLYQVSTSVLRTHEAKRFPGGVIASLSVPWGSSKGDDDLGGYHLVWPRDLVESAGGLLAAGAKEDVRRVLNYLQVTQDSDGHWPQNMWLDGRPYWNGIQMDETALPILLVHLAQREGVVSAEDLQRYWPMIFKAASFLVQNGPVTQQDRWEEDPGYSPFTLSTEIAALLVAADLAAINGNDQMAGFLRETADAWNASIERWIYVSGTDLANQVGVDGYYVRAAPIDTAEASSPKKGYVPIKNRAPSESQAPADQIVSPDALALVRFGLRAPDDPRILNTIKVIDHLLEVDTPSGPAWHRYNQDGYGEHEDGAPFDGTGVGRAWPLLTGERGHYELAASNRKKAVILLHALEKMASKGGLIPEQIWDAPDIPENELFFGKPSGSAMPLVWAHAEYIKLLRSLRDSRVFDTPSGTVQRYLTDKVSSTLSIWRMNARISTIPKGNTLRVEFYQSESVEWTIDGWNSTTQVDTIPSNLGIYYADLETSGLQHGAEIIFRVKGQSATEERITVQEDK